MHPLCQQPLWRPTDLGRPIPPEAGPRAVSVCLPTWADVIGYEEGEDRVIGALRAGYPRFRLPDSVVELGRREAEARARATGRQPFALCLPWPSRAAVERARHAAAHCGAESAELAEPFPASVAVETDCWLLGARPGQERALRLGWRYLGEGLSERRARAALDGQPAPAAAELDAARAELRGRIAAWYGVDPAWVFLFPSGMAAIGAVHRALLVRGAAQRRWPSLQLGFPYVDSLRLQRVDGEAEFFAGRDFARVVERLLPEAGLAHDWLGLFAEVPTNPLIELFDLKALARAARAAGVPVALDDSVASVGLVNALPHADFVTGSLTKWWSGQGDVLGGLAVVNPDAAFAERARPLLEQAERQGDLNHGDLLALAANSRGFAERIERAATTAAVLGRWLESRPEIGSVWWSGSPANRAAWRQLRRPEVRGDIPLLSFVLADPARTPAFHDALEFCKGPSFGADWTLASPYTLLAHYDELDWAESVGVPRDLIRLSVGLEDPTELIERFGRALASSLS